MSGANIGTAYMTVSPRFENLGKSVNDALGSIDTTSSGVKMGQGVSDGFETGTKGLAASGALIGAFSAITSKAMDVISSSVSGAASRMDTLNNYPRIMQTLGYSAADAESSISKMSAHLTGLPTALNDMASTVQGIAAITGNLTEATDAGLALNDMLLASESNTALVNSAMEQFRQMLSKGKPDMQDWKSLTSAMPGQMKQLAQSLLGPTANANDLYTALGGGGATATISMDQLMAKMVEMDSASENGFTSFSDQAKAATGGVQNSFSNMQVAITRGMTDVMQDIGTDTISRVLGDIGSGFESVLKKVGDGIDKTKPLITGIIGVVEDIAPHLGPSVVTVLSLVTAFKGLSSVAGVVSGTSGIMASLGGVAKNLGGTFSTLAGSMASGSRAASVFSNVAGALSGSLGGPLLAATGLFAVTLGVVIDGFIESKKQAELMKKSTDDLVSASLGMSVVASDAGSKVSTYAQILKQGASDADDLAEKQAKLADSMIEMNTETLAQTGMLDEYKSTINELGTTGVDNAEDVARLKIAIDGINEACGTSYVVDDATGAITEQGDAAEVTTGQINGLVDAQKDKIQTDSIQSQRESLYQQEIEDAQKLGDAKKTLDDLNAQLDDKSKKRTTEQINALLISRQKAQENYDSLLSNTDACAQAEENLTTQLEIMTEAGVEGASALAIAMNDNMQYISGALQGTGQSMSDFRSDLTDIGLTQDQLAQITPEMWSQITASYDGSTASIISTLGGLGVQLDSTQQAVVGVNDTPLDSKEAMAEVTGNAADGSAMGAIGSTSDAVLRMNGKSVDVNVNGNYGRARDDIWDLVGGLGNLWSKTIDVWANLRTTGNASGGFRPHADGGIRYHASGGAIARRAVPLDIVGEAGAEAIIPLTNKQYSLPFAKTLAEQMGDRDGTVNYTVNINGDLNDDAKILMLTQNYLEDLIALGRM